MKISNRDALASSRPIKLNNDLIKEMVDFFFENYFAHDNSFEKEFTTRDVRFKNIDFTFKVQYENLNSKNFISARVDVDDNDYSLIIVCDKKYSKTKVRDNLDISKKILISFISHELTHLNDVISEQEYGTGMEKGKSYYYNMHKEFKAHLQQIVTEVADAHNQVKYDKENLEQKDIFLLLGLSPTYRLINMYLNSKHKKIVYQIIYSLIKSGEINDHKK